MVVPLTVRLTDELIDGYIHLFVHECVDERVVDTGALREHCWDGDQAVVFVLVG